jgi:hypothetical protein
MGGAAGSSLFFRKTLKKKKKKLKAKQPRKLGSSLGVLFQILQNHT